MVYIKEIIEPDFGCEGVPDDEVITDKVTFAVNNEDIIINVPEKLVWDLKLDENMNISDELYENIIESCSVN